MPTSLCFSMCSMQALYFTKIDSPRSHFSFCSWEAMCSSPFASL